MIHLVSRNRADLDKKETSELFNEKLVHISVLGKRGLMNMSLSYPIIINFAVIIYLLFLIHMSSEQRNIISKRVFTKTTTR